MSAAQFTAYGAAAVRPSAVISDAPSVSPSLALRISCVVLDIILLGYTVTLLILCAMNKLPAIWISYKIGVTLYALVLPIPVLSIYAAVKQGKKLNRWMARLILVFAMMMLYGFFLTSVGNPGLIGAMIASIVLAAVVSFSVKA